MSIVDINEKVHRKPIDLLAQPSDIEGFTTDILINGALVFSVNLDGLSERGILEIISESMQIGSELLLKDMGKFINDVSNEEH